MNPPDDTPRRRSSDYWTKEAIDVKFGQIDQQLSRIDDILTGLNPLPTEMAKLATRMENLVTKDALHEEMEGLTSRIDANRRALMGWGVAIIVALIGAAATILSSVH